MYKLLEKTSVGLEELAGDSLVIHNKPVLAYVSGLGFGLISGVSFNKTFRHILLSMLNFYHRCLLAVPKCQHSCRHYWPWNNGAEGRN